jgi:DNA-binding MurR/RpiR family transcriptional regulator
MSVPMLVTSSGVADAGSGSGRPPELERLIAERYPTLTPQEQRVADFMRDHLADLAVYNATELAMGSGVSKATVSRLFRRLGFSGAVEVRDHVRAVRAEGVPLTGRTPVDDEALEAHLAAEVVNLHRLAQALAAGRLARLGALLAEANRVLVVGLRNSYPIALHLREQLAQARAGVVLAPSPGQSLGEELSGLESGDVVVLVGFRRRPDGFDELVEAAGMSGASVILVADQSARRLAGVVDEFVECPIDTAGSFDSYAGPMSAVGLIAGAVLDARDTEGKERVEAIAALYEQLGEIEGSR